MQKVLNKFKQKKQKNRQNQLGDQPIYMLKTKQTKRLSYHL